MIVNDVRLEVRHAQGREENYKSKWHFQEAYVSNKSIVKYWNEVSYC